jgi:hypothetical protein
MDSAKTVEYSPQHDEGCRRAVIQYCMVHIEHLVKLNMRKAWSRDSLFLHDALSQFFAMSDVVHWAELKTI